MRMSLTTDELRPTLIQRTEDNGNNSLYINGSKIDPSSWVGTGYYTITCGRSIYTFKKANSTIRNLTLKVIDDYNYEIVPAVTSNTTTPATFDQIYPIGSIYMNVADIKPETIWPGTIWTPLHDVFLLGAGYSYNAGEQGGETTHKLHVDELPNHAHEAFMGNHTHTITIPPHTHRVQNTPHYHSVQLPSHSHYVSLSGGSHAHYEQSGRVFLTGNVYDDYQMKSIKAGSGTSHRVLTDDNGSGGVAEVQATGFSSVSLSGYTGDAGDGTVYTSTDGNDSYTDIAYCYADASYSQPRVVVGPTGGSEAHNNMPPYLAVHMWKRIR